MVLLGSVKAVEFNYLLDVKKYKFIELEIKMPSPQWKWQVIHWFCFSDFQPYLQTISPFPDRFL